MGATKQDIVEMLTESYCMEIETVMNYLANSINPDGVRAEQIKQALAADITEEIMHAQQLGKRIKQLGGLLPGSAAVTLGSQPQPPQDTVDIVAVIKGVITAEEAACQQYLKIINAAHRSDPVTADLCTRLLADEEDHLVLFRGFLKEYEKDEPTHRSEAPSVHASGGVPAGLAPSIEEEMLIGLS